MAETRIIRIALPSDWLLDALEKASSGLVKRLACDEPVVLVVGGASEGNRIAGIIRNTLSERGPGRPRSLTDDDVRRADELVGTGLSIRNAADKLGVSMSALEWLLQGYGARCGSKRKLTDAQVSCRHTAGESVQAIAAGLAVS